MDSSRARIRFGGPNSEGITRRFLPRKKLSMSI